MNEEKSLLEKYKDKVLFYRETLEDLIKGIEEVELGKRKPKALYEIKNYVKENLK